MNNFKKGGFQKAGGGFGGRSKFSGGKKFGGKFGSKFEGGRGRASMGGARHGFAKSDDTFGKRMELFDAVCAKCKKNCKVPFRPTGDKPVYCRECFSGQEQVPGRNSNGKDRVVVSRQNIGEDGIDALRRQITVLESKVNRILELVSKKTEE